MINNNETAIINYLELFYDIKIDKNKKQNIYKDIQKKVKIKMEEIKKETVNILEQYRLLSKYVHFETGCFELRIYCISEDFFKDFYNINEINPEWYKNKKYEIDNNIFIAAGLYKAGIDLKKYNGLKNTKFYLYKTKLYKYLKEEKGVRKSIEHTKFIVYLQKIKEEEIIEILGELKSNNRTEIEQDILFEYLKRT